MGAWLPETCKRREINKIIKQNFAPSWIYLRDYTGMHSQQNIKYVHGYLNSKVYYLYKQSLRVYTEGTKQI